MTFSVAITEHAVATLRTQIGLLDTDLLSGEAAKKVLSLFASAKSSCAAGEALCAARIADTNAWQSSGSKSAADFVATIAGTSLSSARTSLTTGAALSALPELSSAFRSGTLSAEQTNALVPLVQDAPDAIASAKQLSLRELQERARGIKTRDRAHDRKDADRQRRFRSCRQWVSTSDGMYHLTLVTPLAQGAVLQKALENATLALARKAKAEQCFDSWDNLRADALIDLFKGTSSGSVPARASVIVDFAALKRGYARDGEQCFISGLGQIPVAMASDMIDDSVLRLIVKAKGTVLSTRASRTIPSGILAALVARDACCQVPGCASRSFLQNDHRRPFVEGGPTILENLVRLCSRHHSMKSFDGWCLVGPRESWRWVKRRAFGDGGSGYPLDHEEDPDAYNAGPLTGVVRCGPPVARNLTTTPEASLSSESRKSPSLFDGQMEQGVEGVAS